MVIHINNIIEVEMMKLLVASALLLSCLQAFQIYDAVLQTLPAHAKATAARLPQDINWPFDVCGDSDKWEIKSLTLTGQPARNTNDDITATGECIDDFTVANADLNVKLNGVFLHSETVPFAKSYSQGDIVQFKFSNYIPGFAPPGTYKLTFNFKTKSDKVLACFSFSFNL